MERRKKAWMATFAAILIGHAYGTPSESMPIDEPPLAAHQQVDPHVLFEARRRIHEQQMKSNAPAIRACTPGASECP
jgi:hypothetical protein